MTQIDRRSLLTRSVMVAGGLSVAACFPAAAAERFAVRKTDAQWKAQLGSAAYAVLRQEDTERPYSSPLNGEKHAGVFSCKGCANRLFASKTKFESGTGWPSFWAPLPGGVGHEDRPDARHCTDGGALRAVRRPSGSCVRRRAEAHRQALLHERRGDDLPRHLTAMTFLWNDVPAPSFFLQ